MSQLRAYQTVNEETGEVKDKFMYFPGMPLEYRFDARLGQFNIGGKKPILDKKGMPVKNFTFHPLAFRMFKGKLFGRENEEAWIEIFFVDDKRRVSVIMFNSTNVEPFQNLIVTDCFYEEKKLTDLIVTCTPKEVQGEKGSWYICELSTDYAEPEDIEELKQFDEDYKVHRLDTIKEGLTPVLTESQFFLQSPEVKAITQ